MFDGWRLFDWLTDWYVDRLVAKERASLPAIDWRSLLGKIGEEIEAASVYLETRDRRFVNADDPSADGLDIVSLIVTWSRDAIKPWTEQELEEALAKKPAENFVKRMSDRDDVSAVLLLSRRLESFVGYYVQIRPLSRP